MIKKRNTLFDSLKGIGMIGILLIHFGYWYNLSDYLHPYIFKIVSKADYGVELTFIINALLLTYSFNKNCHTKGQSLVLFILSQFRKIIFIYYFSLLVKIIVDCTASASLDYSLGNIISHFLFVNTIKPEYFNSLFGGSGYIGVIAIMWIIYPILLKIFNTKKKSYILFSTFFTVCYCLYMYVIYRYHPANKHVWLVEFLYFIRAFISYSIGNLLSYFLLDKKQNLGKFIVWFVSIMSIIVFAFSIYCGQDNPFLFVAIISLVIYFNYNEPIMLIDNPLFAFIGKHIFSIFIGHILGLYILQRIGCPTTITTAIMNFILIFPISLILEKLVNKPFQSLLFSKRKENKSS